MERLYSATVRAPDPIDFCADADRHLLAALKKRFEGRCFKGAFIDEVLGVEHRGPCAISQTDLSGAGTVDAMFRARVTVFSRGDILVGAVVRAGSEPVTCSYVGAGGGRAAVVLSHSEANSLLLPGMRVPVWVTHASHPPMGATAVVTGVILTPYRDVLTYRVAAGARLSRAARLDLLPLAQAVRDELGARAALAGARREALMFFERLLHSYGAGPAERVVESGAGAPPWEGPACDVPLFEGAAERNLLDALEAAGDDERGERDEHGLGGLWQASLALCRSSPLVAWAPPGTPAPGPRPATSVDAKTLFASLLTTVGSFLRATRELALAYEGDLEKGAALWRYISGRQLSAPAAHQVVAPREDRDPRP